MNPIFGTQPPMSVAAIGYGAGSRNPAGFPNVLRLSVGESDVIEGLPFESVTVLETALDDLSPQVVAYVAETALAQGALDVMLTPVIMKKGRPGTLITILCDPAQSTAMTALLLRETSTLGVRIHQDLRQAARPRPHDRRHALWPHPRQTGQPCGRGMERHTGV